MTDTLAYMLEKFGITEYPRSSHPIEVPSFTRDDLALSLSELGFVNGVEIGVSTGVYSKVLCSCNPMMTVYSIDPWTPEAYKDSRFGMPYLCGEFETNFQEARDRLLPFMNSRVIRSYSLEAVKQFADNCIDFVYIDGNHDFQNVTNDICEWIRKVRKGGIISGHDYTRYAPEREIHVKQVVDAYTYAHRICPWFVLGNKNKSWMWIKE